MSTTTTPLLFTPIALRSITSRNRVMVSPMCQYCAPSAVPHDWHFVHLVSRAIGGAGVVATEATAVEPIGRITPYDVGLWSDEQEAAFARIARSVAEHGAVPAMQLAHAGRKASHGRPWEHRDALTKAQGGWEPIGPSAIPWEPGDLVPREMTSADIERVIAAFAQAASRALRAGFRMLELHAAHGYLLHSFLSPISNRRTDAYGGTLQNRIRIVVECVRAVRTAWPSELPLSVRVSATDWIAGGWELDDTVHLARTLAAEGVDIVDCSTGGSGREQDVRAFPGYQLAFAETVRKRAGIPTAGVGLLSDPHMIEQMLQRRQADMAVLGRALLWDPYWTHHAASSLGVEPALPIQYARSATHAPRSRVRAAPQRLAHP